jgi:hypothetical protein
LLSIEEGEGQRGGKDKYVKIAGRGGGKKEMRNSGLDKDREGLKDIRMKSQPQICPLCCCLLSLCE